MTSFSIPQFRNQNRHALYYKINLLSGKMLLKFEFGAEPKNQLSGIFCVALWGLSAQDVKEEAQTHNLLVHFGQHKQWHCDSCPLTQVESWANVVIHHKGFDTLVDCIHLQLTFSAYFCNLKVRRWKKTWQSGPRKRGVEFKGGSRHDWNRHNRRNRQNRQTTTVASLCCIL